MDETIERTLADSGRLIGNDEAQIVAETERIEIANYPEMPDTDTAGTLAEEVEREVEELVANAHSMAEARPAQVDEPAGYVSNARNATATSDEFQLWSPAETTSLAIGSIVLHEGSGVSGGSSQTYGIVVATEGQTLGLDDLAIHVYETDARPPHESIQPAASRRRPVVLLRARVLSSSEPRPRPVVSGPVRALRGDELLAAHGRYLGRPKDRTWLERDGMLLGFYEDGTGDFGVFAEERARVLGPKQGHLVLSGVPGAGKTSMFLTLLISLYAHLRRLAASDTQARAPRVAAVAFNVKGTDLLFLDHMDQKELDAADRVMWRLAGVDPRERPFGRVVVYVPLAEDGLNRHSLRTNLGANIAGYSETREFAFGIAQLWPYLGLLFDRRSMPAANLLAEVRDHFERSQDTPFTLAEVLTFFRTTLLLPEARRAHEWQDHPLNVISAVYSRLRALGTTLGGLIDVTGTGFGLERLTDLAPYDLVVVDLERIMADPPDPEIAEIAVKIVTHFVLQQLTEAVTRRRTAVDHVIVFADELNRLAPAQGDTGVGEYLAHLARTTRDRGVVLFGAGQFRSGINADILKAAAVHYSMQTPEYELSDPIYGALSAEFKARLTRLQPGETLLQFPSLRTAVFARFPRPFVLTGTQGPERLPPADPRPIADCIADRLARLDPARPPRPEEVDQLVDQVLRTPANAGAQADDASAADPAHTVERELLRILRDLEMQRGVGRGQASRESPWQQFRRLVQARSRQAQATPDSRTYTLPPAAAFADTWDDTDSDEE